MNTLKKWEALILDAEEARMLEYLQQKHPRRSGARLEAEAREYRDDLAEGFLENNGKYGTCCLCGALYIQWGHNPDPLAKGKAARCCDLCNTFRVLPARAGQESITA